MPQDVARYILAYLASSILLTACLLIYHARQGTHSPDEYVCESFEIGFLAPAMVSAMMAVLAWAAAIIIFLVRTANL